MTQPPSKGSNLSRPELASELVQDILKHKLEERRQEQGGDHHGQGRQQQGRLRTVLLALLPLFLGLVVWNLTAGRKRPVVFTQAELDAGARFKVFLAAQALTSFRDSAGHWPASLAQVGFADEGLSYQQADTTYELTAVSGGIRFTYRSGEDLSFFRDAPQDLMR